MRESIQSVEFHRKRYLEKRRGNGCLCIPFAFSPSARPRNTSTAQDQALILTSHPSGISGISHDQFSLHLPPHIFTINKQGRYPCSDLEKNHPHCNHCPWEQKNIWIKAYGSSAPPPSHDHPAQRQLLFCHLKPWSDLGLLVFLKESLWLPRNSIPTTAWHCVRLCCQHSLSGETVFSHFKLRAWWRHLSPLWVTELFLSPPRCSLTSFWFAAGI